MSKVNRINIMCVFLFVLWSLCSADVVYLKDGKQWEGNIIREDEDEVVLEFAPGARITFPRESVKSIERAASPAADDTTSDGEDIAPDALTGKNLEEALQPTISEGTMADKIAEAVLDWQTIRRQSGPELFWVLGVYIFFVVGYYIYWALSLHIIANKTATEHGWMAWVPILNIYLLCRLADKPGWWLLLLLIPFVNIIIMVIVWGGIAEVRGKPGWLGILILVPVANVILPGYLAFSKHG